MDKSKVLWFDLRYTQDKISSYHHLDEGWDVSHAKSVERIDRDISDAAPILLCFEFDYPDISSLMALRQARCLFPSIPIIMLTEHHSEALAVWALRLRVWDYFVKPFQSHELSTSAATVLTQDALSEDNILLRHQHSNTFNNPLPSETRLHIQQKKKTNLAHAYVETHYHEKIYEEEVAKLCGMNPSTFSRHFKKEHGQTFRHYLINYRIKKAQDLLENPSVMVADIAYTVGFNDPSYFTRMFRRIIGMSPSRYHEMHSLSSSRCSRENYK